MTIYLDMCCLKRPFDDQSQPRIRLESEAVLSVLTLESDQIQFVRSEALVLENSQNPVKERAERVDQWLTAGVRQKIEPKALEGRAAELMRLGLRNFDALHIACAEQSHADMFCSCDDDLLRTAARNRDQIKVRVLGVLELAREVLK